MPDEKDLEIARLKGRLEQAQAANGPSGGKALLWILGIAAAVFIGLAIFGSTLPAGFRFEGECRSVTTTPEAAKLCMRELDAVYRGPDEHRYRKNAVDQWARDNPSLARSPGG